MSYRLHMRQSRVHVTICGHRKIELWGDRGLNTSLRGRFARWAKRTTESGRCVAVNSTIGLQVELLEERALPASGIPGAFVQRGPGGGGALFSPALSPHSPNNLFIASDMSQLFRSTDAGVSWSTTDFRQIQGGHETSVQFTNDPNIVYTVDYTTFSDGSSTQRPMKSTNAGATWSPTAADPTGGGTYKLFVDPANSNRLLISDYSTLWVSSDGGGSFTQKYTTAAGGGLHMAGVLFDGSNIYLGTSVGVLVSTNGGSSFALSPITGIPASEAILSFTAAHQGATTRFFAVTAPVGDVFAGVQTYDLGASQKVYGMDYGVSNWTLKMSGIPATANPVFAGMANNDVNVAYIAGGSTAGAPTIYKTINGGTSWTSVFTTASNQNITTGWQGSGGDRQWSYGEIPMGFAVQTNDSSRAIITDYGFAHMTTNGGGLWNQLYVAPADQNPAGSNIVQGRYYHESGLDNTTAWQVTWADANNLIVANSDIGGSISNNAGQSFGFGYTGQSRNTIYRTLIHPTTGVIYAATSSVHDMYQSTYLTDARIDGGNGAVLFSTNQGHAWTTLHDFANPVIWVASDPTNSNRLYAAVIDSAVGGIYVTNNLNAGAASTWTKLPNPPRTQGHAFNIVVLNDGTLVTTFSGRRAGSPQAFTNSSGVFISTDGGQNWTDRSAAGMLYWTHDLVVDPFDPTQNTWYAGVYSGWGGPPNDLGGLYKTTNRGQSWTRVFTTQGVSSITFNPTDSSEAWVTTESAGLWYSNNMRAATPTFSQVASYPFRQPQRVFYNPFNPSEIWVTSFGNGIRVGNLASSNQPPVNQVPGAQTMTEGTPKIFSSANGNAIAVSDPDAGSAVIQVSLSGAAGTMNLSTLAGLTFTSGANNSSAMTFRGTISAINTALNGMSFASAFNQPTASIQIVTDDLGNTGGGSQTDTDTVPISVTLLPRVSGVYVRGSSWSAAFLNHLVTVGAGNSTLGFALQTGAQQATALPWTNINQVSVAFSKAVTVAQASLALRGLNVTNYAVGTLSYNTTTFVATWTLPSPLAVDRLRIDVAASGANAVRDASSNALDGTWTDGVSTFVSGNSTAGVNFLFRFNVLPGGAIRGTSVLNSDLNAVRAALFETPGGAGYSIFVDTDASGQINNSDLNAVRSRLFDSLPGGTPNRPARQPARTPHVVRWSAAAIDELFSF